MKDKMESEDTKYEEKIALRGILRHYWRLGKSAKASSEKICEIENNDNLVKRKTASIWFRRFNEGRLELVDKPKPGRSRTFLKDETGVINEKIKTGKALSNKPKDSKTLENNKEQLLSSLQNKRKNDGKEKITKIPKKQKTTENNNNKIDKEVHQKAKRKYKVKNKKEKTNKANKIDKNSKNKESNEDTPVEVPNNTHNKCNGLDKNNDVVVLKSSNKQVDNNLLEDNDKTSKPPIMSSVVNDEKLLNTPESCNDKTELQKTPDKINKLPTISSFVNNEKLPNIAESSNGDENTELQKTSDQTTAHQENRSESNSKNENKQKIEDLNGNKEKIESLLFKNYNQSGIENSLYEDINNGSISLNTNLQTAPIHKEQITSNTPSLNTNQANVLPSLNVITNEPKSPQAENKNEQTKAQNNTVTISQNQHNDVPNVFDFEGHLF